MSEQDEVVALLHTLEKLVASGTLDERTTIALGVCISAAATLADKPITLNTLASIIGYVATNVDNRHLTDIQAVEYMAHIMTTMEMVKTEIATGKTESLTRKNNNSEFGNN